MIPFQHSSNEHDVLERINYLTQGEPIHPRNHTSGELIRKAKNISNIAPPLDIEVDRIEGFPDNLQCPICFNILTQPIMDECGHTFDYECILKCIENISAPSCPISKQHLSVADLRTNFFARYAVEVWLKTRLETELETELET